MIPKIIHYVWVGDKEKPDSVYKCIESWKKFCHDYEIIEWDNEKFKKIKNTYSTQAFENKKWAFVSDYIRLYALYNYGGIYLDTDVEITQNIDKFLVHDFVSGFEKWENIFSPITAFMGSERENQIIKDLLGYYQTNNFITEKGFDIQPNTQRITEYFIQNFGLQKPFDGTKTVELCQNCIIYPYYYFCKRETEKENFAIHHFDGSWLDNYNRKDLLKVGKFKISRLKYRKGKNTNILPLTKDENLISLNIIGQDKYILLIKEESKIQ